MQGEEGYLPPSAWEKLLDCEVQTGLAQRQSQPCVPSAGAWLMGGCPEIRHGYRPLAPMPASLPEVLRAQALEETGHLSRRRTGLQVRTLGMRGWARVPSPARLLELGF